MSNTEMRTILQDLRVVIAKQIEREFMPLCVCPKCDNEVEGALIARIVKAIKDADYAY